MTEPEEAEDYELLPSDPQAADENLQKPLNMGLEEELEKKEGRKGDSLARYAAIVRPAQISSTQVNLSVLQSASAVRSPDKTMGFPPYGVRTGYHDCYMVRYAHQ